MMTPGDRPDDRTRLEAILDATGDAIFTSDLAGTITWWTRGAERLYGFEASEVVGRSILTLTAGNRADDGTQILADLARGESVRNMDTIRVRRDGTPMPVALAIVPLRSKAGAIVGTLHFARDLSGRHEADRAARRLAAIVQSSDDAIVSKDLRGIVMSWNRAAERMFGYTAEEMIGQSIRLLIPADRQSEEDHVLASIVQGVGVDHFETVRRHKSGSPIPISLTVSPIHDDTGQIVGASKIARDITERRQSEIERARLLAIAEQNAAITSRLIKSVRLSRPASIGRPSSRR